MQYDLMYRDIPVIRFDIDTMQVQLLHKSMVPYSIVPKDMITWGDIRNFCSQRVLMMNRKYCKEILDACEVEDQSDVNICLVSKGLSFRDNYWIKRTLSEERWKDINLYENPFSEDIAITSLTGEVKNVHIGDSFFTGELTSRGTRAKCFVRSEGNVYLAKNETLDEIASEIISFKLTEALRLPGTRYINTQVYGKECAVCKIETSPKVELIPCADVLKRYRSDFCADSAYYDEFIRIDPENFIKMQIFDCTTYNTDRNRDNFGLQKCSGKIMGMYPVYDHDSCFKGISNKGHYFVTGMTFSDSILYIADRYKDIMNQIYPDIRDYYDFVSSRDFKNDFLKYKNEAKYESLISQIDYVLCTCSICHNLIRGEAGVVCQDDKDDADTLTIQDERNSYVTSKDNVSVECVTKADGSGKLTLDNGNDIITVPFKGITALEGVEVDFIGWTEADVDKASEAIDEVLEQIPGCDIKIAGDEEQEIPEHEELSNDEIEQNDAGIEDIETDDHDEISL